MPGSTTAAGDSDDVVAAATRELNFVLRSHRAAAGDPYARDVRADHALVVRLGYGEGEQVADGRFGRAVELPKEPAKRKRGEALAPQERLAAILGGRDTLLVGEELLLRAQLDLDAGRTREAALQARVALESLLGELDEKFAAPLRPLREPVARAANAALDGELSAADDDRAGRTPSSRWRPPHAGAARPPAPRRRYFTAFSPTCRTAALKFRPSGRKADARREVKLFT